MSSLFRSIAVAVATLALYTQVPGAQVAIAGSGHPGLVVSPRCFKPGQFMNLHVRLKGGRPGFSSWVIVSQRLSKPYYGHRFLSIPLGTLRVGKRGHSTYTEYGSWGLNRSDLGWVRVYLKKLGRQGPHEGVHIARKCARR